MMTQGTEPLLPLAGNSGDGSSIEPKRQLSELLCASGLACLGLCLSQTLFLHPELAAAPRPILLASGPLGLGGVLGPVGEFLGAIYGIFKPFAFVFKYSGIVLFVLIFILSFLNHAKNFKGFVDRMQGFGLPCPTFMAFGGLFCLFAGCLCYLTGVPVLMEWGAEFLLIFLIASTYYGHFKPWKQTGDMTHFLMMMKNVSIAGACLMTIGFVVPEIGKEDGPLGLHGALGPVGVFLGEIYDVFRPYSYTFKYSGIVLFVLIFMLSFLMHAKNFKGFVDRMQGFGLPCPTFMAFGGLFCLFAGCLCYLTGVPVLMEWGAEFLLIFLTASTYYGHFKPWKQTGDMTHFLMMMKNVSIAGACLMTIGCVVPQIGPS